MGNRERLGTVTFLVTIMLLAPIAGAVGATGSTVESQEGSWADDPDIDVVEPQDGVSIWTKSPLSLRADHGNADVSVDTPPVLAKTNQGDTYLNRNSVAVYNAGDEVTLEFGQHDDVNASVLGDSAQLVTLHHDSLPSDVSMTDVINGNAESLINEYVDEASGISYTDVTIGENGTFTKDDVDLDEPGYYTFMVTNDVTFSGGLPDDITIAGVEQVVAHEKSSTVNVTEPDDPAPGDNITDNITFDVDATAFDDDTEVEHSIVLYDESNFSDSQIDVTITGDINTDLREDNLSVRTDFGSINGVQTTPNGTISGEVDINNSINDAMDARDEVSDLIENIPFNAPGPVDYVLNDLNSVPLETGDQQLDASSTTVVGNASENITVETLDDWTKTEYQWVHVATSTDAASDELQANAGTLDLNASEDDSDGDDDDGDSGGIGGGIGGGGSPADPEFSVTKAGLSSSEIAAGDAVDVTAKIEETSGDRGGQFTAELTVDGEVVDTETVTIFAGESENVTFTRSFDEVGEYEIAVSDAPAGTLTVSETGPGEPGSEAEFEVSEASLSGTDLEVGEDVEVTATVENTGSEAGTFTAELTVDGQVVAEKTVTLNSGDAETVMFTHSFGEAGDFEIGVSGTTIGTVTVSDGSGLLPVPGFGMGAALAALLAVALLGARLQD